jgi:SprT protein
MNEKTTTEKMDFYTFQKTLRDDTQTWVDLANESFGLDLTVNVSFDLKGRTAGQAFTSKGLIKYNLAAYNVEGGIEHLINHTVPHEVAHMVQYNNPQWPNDRKSNSSHGNYWKLVMNHFGVEATRCHSLPLPTARTVKKQFKYVCGCKEWNLTAIRHNKIVRGTRVYSCPECKVVLRQNNNQLHY